ncbi:hypothetical protein GGR53DRAFT_473081 [Hypoxylon sp. FL1150]|nr:hypothetical protein GGR53DRAFT_473081 [Hypoxylon sp. FL1150]
MEHTFNGRAFNIPDGALRSAGFDRQPRHTFSDGLSRRPEHGIASPVTVPYTFPVPGNRGPHPEATRSLSISRQLGVSGSNPEAPSTLSTSMVSRASSLGTQAEQQRFARELFEQHGIRRPSGWFSDEDLPISGDRTAEPRRPCRICHVCSSRTWSEAYCLSCNHRLCGQCPCETPQSTTRGRTSFSHHPGRTGVIGESHDVQPKLRTTHVHQRISRPASMVGNNQAAQQMTVPRISHVHSHGNFHSKSRLESRGSNRLTHQHSMPAVMAPSLRRLDSSRGPAIRPISLNPFVIADRATEDPAPEPCIAEQSAIQESGYSITSQLHTHGSSHGSSATHSECSNPMCRATHDGHYPYRHSIICALHRSEASVPHSITRSPNSQSARDKSVGLEGTVRRHPRTSFHGHHHLVEHLAGEISHGIHEHHTHPVVESVEEQISPGPSATKLEVQHHEGYMPITPVQQLRRVGSLRDNQRIETPSHHNHGKYPKRNSDIEHDPERSTLDINQSRKQSSHVEQSEPSSVTDMRHELKHSSHERQAHMAYDVLSQRRESDHIQPQHSGQRYRDRLTTYDHTVDRLKTLKGQLSRRISKEPVNAIAQSNSPIPKGRVLSPPPWLKAPSKQAGDARSRLRHVNTKIPRYPSNVCAAEERSKSSRGPPRRSIRESTEKLGLESQVLPRISAPSPTTAWHVTQHQRPESWIGDSSEHVRSRASYEAFTDEVGASPVSPCGHPPVGNQQLPSDHKQPPTHLQGENIRYTRSGFLSPSSALHSRQSIKQHSHVHQSAQGQRQDEVGHHETGSSNYQMGYTQPPSSTLTGFSGSPLQPRHILLDIDVYQNPTCESRTPIPGAGGSRERLDDASEYGIHRPSPIAPPNHDCGWRERYQALTGEIRLLKAELSTRASLRGMSLDYMDQEGERAAADDDDLGILGVTIIMRLRGRDDLVINTDLTQD